MYAVLVLAGIGGALAIGELVARLTWSDPVRPKPPVRQRPAEDRENLPVLRGIAALAKPNVRGVLPAGVFFRTNSAGFRGPEYSRSPARGAFRIIVVGDSVTMGTGVEEEDAYPALLEGMLNAELSTYRYEVLNLGLAGISSQQVVRRLERLGLPFNPHLFIYGWTVNDIQGPGYEPRDKPAGHLAAQVARNARFRQSPSYLLRILWSRWIWLSDLFFTDPFSYRAELFHNYSEDAAAWARFTNDLSRLAEIAEERGICGAVFIHTHLASLGFFHPLRPIYERVAEAAAERGLTPIHSFPLLSGEDERTLRVSLWDHHPNAAGNELLARALLEGIRSLPERCWGPRSPRRGS